MALYDRLPNEPYKWYNRFRTFMLLGPERSLSRAYQVLRDQQYKIESGEHKEYRAHSVPKKWRSAATRYKWFTRARAWDAAVFESLEDTRRAEVAETNFYITKRMQEKALQMLDAPLYEDMEVTDDGVIVRKPVRWTLKDVATFVRAIAEINGLTKQHGSTIINVGSNSMKSSDYSEEEIKQIASGLKDLNLLDQLVDDL